MKRGSRKLLLTSQSSLVFCFCGVFKTKAFAFGGSLALFPSPPLDETISFFHLHCSDLLCVVPFLAVIQCENRREAWWFISEGSRGPRHSSTFRPSHLGSLKFKAVFPNRPCELATEYLLPVFGFSSSQAPLLPFLSSYRCYRASFVAGGSLFPPTSILEVSRYLVLF